MNTFETALTTVMALENTLAGAKEDGASQEFIDQIETDLEHAYEQLERFS